MIKGKCERCNEISLCDECISIHYGGDELAAQEALDRRNQRKAFRLLGIKDPSKNPMEDLKDTWTITAELTVFAGDMEKYKVIEEAQRILEDITDGTDFCGVSVTDAKRDE